jgi:dienelactone hydrolase
MAQLCLLGQHDELHAQALALVGHYLRSDPAVTPPWSTLLAQNTPGPLSVPLYVAQGDADSLVLPAATKQFVAQQCAAGAHVTFALYPGDDHGSIALKAVPAVLSFFTAVLAGTPPASTC